MVDINNKRILVIGDVCLDKFVYCDFIRICPESPVPLLSEKYSIQNLGMAGNVASNLLSLGISHDLLTPDRNDKISTKVRYVDEKTNVMFFRVDDDIENSESINIKNIDFSKYDAVIVSDYDKGFLTHNSIHHICNEHPHVFVDTKKPISNWANPKYFKINNHEWKNSNYYEAENVIVTMGKQGCYYNKRYYSTTEYNSYDVSGAGDTFLATLVSAYVLGHHIDTCLKVANMASADVVLKKGVSTPDLKITQYIENLKD